MSWWGTLEARFTPTRSMTTENLAGCITNELERRDTIAPTGSESGPRVRYDDTDVRVEGRLRDVNDPDDSPMVLAWFVHHGRWCSYAELMWELDSGPRYRYVLDDGKLIRLRGVLE